MKRYRRIIIQTLIVACCALPIKTSVAQPAATDYPDKPIKLWVPYAAGGATDVLARLLAMALAERLGQAVVVENKPGASTMLAAGLVANAPADGYTLLLGANTTLTLNPAIRTSLSYDPLRSFTYLGRVADMPLLLVAPSDGPATLAELVRLAKAEPGRIAYGSFGAGSSVHFGGEQLKHAAGIDMLHVPYQGSAQSLSALMGKQVQIAVDTLVAAAPLVNSGKIRALATLSDQRLPLLPAVPTVAESGYPGFAMSTWFALLAPAGLPVSVQDRITAALASIAADSAITQRMVALGLTPVFGSAEEMLARVESESPKMRTIAQQASIQVD